MEIIYVGAMLKDVDDLGWDMNERLIRSFSVDDGFKGSGWLAMNVNVVVVCIEE